MTTAFQKWRGVYSDGQSYIKIDKNLENQEVLLVMHESSDKEAPILVRQVKAFRMLFKRILCHYVFLSHTHPPPAPHPVGLLGHFQGPQKADFLYATLFQFN